MIKRIVDEFVLEKFAFKKTISVNEFLDFLYIPKNLRKKLARSFYFFLLVFLLSLISGLFSTLTENVRILHMIKATYEIQVISFVIKI